MLTVDDLNAARAQWEEWTAGAGLELTLEVKLDRVEASMLAAPVLGARVGSDSRYVQLEVWRAAPAGGLVAAIADAFEIPGELLGGAGAVRILAQRVPYDAVALRASVAVLARMIAAGSGLIAS